MIILDFGMLELDRLPLAHQSKGSPVVKMKQARVVKNIKDYGSKKFERQYKSGKKNTSSLSQQYRSGPAEGHQIVENITFGPGGGIQM